MTDPRTLEQSEKNDITVQEAVDVLRRDYYGDVTSYAEEIKRAIADDEITDRDDLLTRIHETADGSQWVIYTYRNMRVLLVSDNSDAYAEEYGSEGMIKDGAINWAALAYAALERDIIDALDTAEVNVNGDDKAEMLGLEEEEEAEGDDNA
ncbi:MAG TPA: hypothetical protein VH439_17250 [Gemmatimonadales bacterium]|jgi:hypothetical protein